jgi:NAD(P)-dependent dehydrogenase (short-subunit alcohol dehydrogenase family)
MAETTGAPDAFKNKIAIVTGGAMGLGRALCEELARKGATVVVADIKGDAATQVANRISQNGGNAHAAQIDVSKRQDITSLIERTAADFGRLDYVFNNAVLVIGGDARDISPEQWERTLGVDLLGVVYGAVAAYRVMAKQGHGHIVNVSSATGLIPQPGNTPYCTSKWGIVGLSLSLRCEGADLGVKVSCVCPGDMKTDIYENMTIMNWSVRRDEFERVTRRTHVLMPQWTAEQAVAEILRGVTRNKALIIFPAVIRWIWRIYRAFPSVIFWISIQRMRMFRKFRIDN